MSDTPRTSSTSRRTVLRAAAWAAPTIAVAAPAPAMAATAHDQKVQILFDGGGGTNGWVDTVYVNLLPAGGLNGTSFTTTLPMTFTIDIIGLNTSARDERSLALNARNGTTATRAAYNPATRTTRVTWTVPAGVTITNLPQGGAKINLAIEFKDGLSSTSGAGRITNKVVVRSVEGGMIVGPTNPPVDSSVVKDYNKGAASPDGIY